MLSRNRMVKKQKEQDSMNQRFCNGMVHVIKDGETLYQLSRMYRVPIALILRANPYLDVYNLQIGQEICIPMMRRPFPGMGMTSQPRSESERDEMENGTRDNMVSENTMQQEITETMEAEAELQEEGKEDQQGSEAVVQEQSVVYEMDGNIRVGDILEKHKITLEEFMQWNDPAQWVLAENTTYEIGKKV